MGRKSQLSNHQRSLLIDLKNQGLTYQRISEQTGIPQTTIKNNVKKFKTFGTVSDLMGRGRKRKTTPRIDRAILQSIGKNRKESAVKIAKDLETRLNIKLCPQTIRNRIHEGGYKARVARKKPFLKRVHKRARLAFALEHENKPLSFWEKILWSDESKFNLVSADGPTKVWRKSGEAYSLSCMRATVKFGGGNVMIWGCMAANGQGKFCFIDTTMNAEHYCSILDNNLFQSADQLSMPPDFIFQQDNDPKHTSKKAQDWFNENGVQVMKWPAMSPDLNPIEHLWYQLEKLIGDRHYTNKGQLKKAITESWPKLELAKIKKLVESMPSRLKAVIKAKGGSTKY